MLLILLAGILAYANSFSVPFLFDDGYFILDPRAQAFFWPLWKVFIPPPHFQPWVHRPLVTLTLAINHLMSGPDPWGYHAVNLAIHLANGLLLLTLLRRRIRPGPALAAALLWTVHPLNTEGVTYIWQRGESLMALFTLLTLYCLTRASESPAAKRWSILAVAACAAGMMGKQTMVVVPALALLVDRIFLAGSWKKLWRERGRLHLGLMATWGIVAALLLAASRNGVPSNAGLSYHEITPWEYFRSQPGALLHYLRLAFWPEPLVFDYGWPVAHGITSVLLPGLAILALLGLTAWLLWRRPAAGFLGAWCFIVLSPVSTIFATGEIVTEHRMVLPLMAVVTAAVLAAGRLLRDQGRLAVLLSMLAATTLAAATVRRNEDYRSAISLWEDTVAKRPANYRAHSNLATAYLREKQAARAIPHFREAIRLNPGNPQARNNFAVALLKVGYVEEAMQQLQEAIRLDPKQPESKKILDQIYQISGRSPARARSSAPSADPAPPGRPAGPPAR